MKHFVIELTYTVPFEQIETALPDHRRFLQAGYEGGWLLCSGPQLPKTGGIIIARTPSRAELEQFFASDPFQLRGLATYRYIEFEPRARQAFLETWTGAES